MRVWRPPRDVRRSAACRLMSLRLLWPFCTALIVGVVSIGRSDMPRMRTPAGAGDTLGRGVEAADSWRGTSGKAMGRVRGVGAFGGSTMRTRGADAGLFFTFFCLMGSGLGRGLGLK